MKPKKFVSYFENGTKKSVSYLLNGERHGRYVEYNNDGKIVKRYKYHKGKLNGYYYFLENDGSYFECHYKNNIIDKYFILYDNNVKYIFKNVKYGKVYLNKFYIIGDYDIASVKDNKILIYKLNNKKIKLKSFYYHNLDELYESPHNISKTELCNLVKRLMYEQYLPPTENLNDGYHFTNNNNYYSKNNFNFYTIDGRIDGEIIETKVKEKSEIVFDNLSTFSGISLGANSFTVGGNNNIGTIFTDGSTSSFNVGMRTLGTQYPVQQKSKIFQHLK